MSKANDEQHGGDHYKTQAVQVWDYVTANGIPYLEGNVIKYVSRWRAKGGLEDLRKARHYLDKIIENEEAVWDYVTANGIPYLEGNVIKYVSRWRVKGGLEDLHKARHYLDKIIENEEARLLANPPPPPPCPHDEPSPVCPWCAPPVNKESE